MAHGYGDGYYGSFTYGSLDGEAQPTLLSSQVTGPALSLTGQVADWRLSTLTPGLTVLAAAATSLSVQVDELI